MKSRILRFVVISFSIGLVFAPVANGIAQDLGSVGKQTQNMGDVTAVMQKLHLNPQQVQQVLPILRREAPKLQAIKGNSHLTSDQRVAQTKAVQQQSDSKLKTILSPEQFSSLQNFRAQQLRELVHGVKPF